jgi:hypothetical protein
MNMLGLLWSIRIAHIACYWKFFFVHSSISPGFAKQIMPILRVLYYDGSLVNWKILSLTNTKFKPLIFSMSSFALSSTANMFVLMILYDFCLFPAQFCYINVLWHDAWMPEVYSQRSTAETSIARQRPSRHFPAAMNKLVETRALLRN